MMIKHEIMGLSHNCQTDPPEASCPFQNISIHWLFCCLKILTQRQANFNDN